MSKKQLKVFRDSLTKNITNSPVAVTGFFTFTFVDRRTNWRLQISIIKDPARNGLHNVDVSFIGPKRQDVEPKAFSLLVDEAAMPDFLERLGEGKVPSVLCERLAIKPEWFIPRQDLSLLYYRAENKDGVVRLEARRIFPGEGFHFDQISYKLSESGPTEELRSSTVVENVTLPIVLELFIRLVPDKY